MKTPPVIGIAADHTPYTGTDDRRAEGVMEAYMQAVLASGGTPLILPVSLSGDALLHAFALCEGVLLPGGHDIDPARYGQTPLPTTEHPDSAKDDLDITLAQWCVKTRKPILGICRGMQIVNIANRGTLVQNLQTQRPSDVPHANGYPAVALSHTAHAVRIQAGSNLHTVLGVQAARVNGRHHQGIDRLGKGLVATAWAPDEVIEALELPGHPFCIGVEWHPENLLDEPPMHSLFQSFVAAAGNHRR